MSMPAMRTALREADSRCTSPSSQRVTSEVQLAHPVESHQRPAARLAACELTQLTLERRHLGVDRVDHRQRDLDPLARVDRELEALQERSALVGAQLLRAAIDTVVKQRRANALKPLRALAEQRVPQPRS